jgi:hypothetical protein
MLGADTAISGIIRLVTTVGILAAVYFLIVKPVLNTTEDVVHHATHAAGVQQQNVNDQISRAEVSADRQRALSYAQSALAGSMPWYAAANMLRHCVKAADGDGRKMSACANAGQHLTNLFSPRSQAISWAQSLDTEGKADAAAQIRKCVDNAKFNLSPMLHCRDQAQHLLFG